MFIRFFRAITKRHAAKTERAREDARAHAIAFIDECEREGLDPLVMIKGSSEPSSDFALWESLDKAQRIELIALAFSTGTLSPRIWNSYRK